MYVLRSLGAVDMVPLLPHQNGFHHLSHEDLDLSNKKHYATDSDDDDVDNVTDIAIIPGLPRPLAYNCLARVPRESHFLAAQVSSSWRRAFVSGDVYRLRRQMGISEPWIYLAFCPNFKVLSRYSDQLVNLSCQNEPYLTWLEAYDPVFNVWHNLGRIPGIPENHSLKGFGFAALGDKLYLLGGCVTPNPMSINQEGRNCDSHQHHKSGNDCNSSCSNGSIISSSISKNNVGSNDSKEKNHSNNECLMQIQEVIRKEVLVFNCTTRQWSECASMSTPRVNFACTVCKGRIYVAGGRSQPLQEKGVSSAEVYIRETDCWMALPGMSTGRYKCVGVTCEEKIHIVGGFAGPEGSDHPFYPYSIDRSCVDVFHPLSGQWTLLKGMWQLDVPPNQIVNVEGRLYSSGDALNSWKGRVEEYDTSTNLWNIIERSRLPMTHPEECENSERCYLTMAPIGHRLFFLGGYRLPSDGVNACLHTVYIFDTVAQDAASQWQLVEPVQGACKELCTHGCVVTL